MTDSLRGKTLFISGGSRGIGLAIALRAARDGANVTIAAKTTTPHPSLPGTIHTAAAQIEAAGGHALAVSCDIREESQVEERWFAPHVGYTMAKFGMSLVVLGVAGEYRGRVGVNALWPRTAIDTAAMAEFGGRVDLHALRSPEIMADAAWWVLRSDARSNTGQFLIDDEVLAAHGVADLAQYGADGVADIDLVPDFFVPSLRELRGLPEPGNPYARRRQ